MTVGLCWQGSPLHRNDRNRSLPRGVLAPLAQVAGVTWLSLCKEGWSPELGQLGLLNGMEGCADWMDTAQVIANLDLVVTVDTAVAHVAGGLGVPVWILIPAVPDLRWGLGGSRTPWYQSARLYRQQKAGEWGPVIESICRDLTTLVAERNAA